MKNKSKILMFSLIPSVSLVASTMCVLTSCKSAVLDVKLMNSSGLKISKSIATSGKLFEAQILPTKTPTLTECIIINSISIFANGKKLNEGPKDQGGDYSCELLKDEYQRNTAANITIYDPQDPIYIFPSTSNLGYSISFCDYDPVNIYRNRDDVITFNYNDEILPDNDLFLQPEISCDNDLFNENFEIKSDEGAILLDRKTYTFGVKVGLKDGSSFAPTEPYDFIVQMSIKYEINGQTVTCSIPNIPIRYINQDKDDNKTVLMQEQDSKIYFSADDSSYTYKMTLDTDTMPFGNSVNVSLGRVSYEGDEKWGNFFVKNSVVPVIEDENGKKTFSVTVNYAPDIQKESRGDDHIHFNFDITYIDSDFKRVTTTATYDGKENTPNLISLSHQKVLSLYSSSSQFSTSQSKPAIYEFTSSAFSDLSDLKDVTTTIYDVDENQNETVSDDLMCDTDSCKIIHDISGKVIVQIAVKNKKQGSYIYQNHKFYIKMQLTKESGTEDVLWQEEGQEPKTQSPTLYYTSVDCIPLNTTWFNFKDGTIYGLTDYAIKYLEEEYWRTESTYNSIIIPHEIEIGEGTGEFAPVYQVAKDAFKNSSDSQSGTIVNLWTEKRAELGWKSALLFEDVYHEDDPTWKSNLQYINQSAFEGQTYFSNELKIPNSVMHIGDYAFKNCANDSSNGNGFTSLHIGTYEYEPPTTEEETDLGNFVTHSKLTYIGKQAFYNSKDSSKSTYKGNLILPNTVVTIGSQCFANTGFDGVLHFSKEFNWKNKIQTSLFEGCRNLLGVCSNDFYPTCKSEDPSEQETYKAVFMKNMFKNCSSFTGTYTYKNDGTTTGWVSDGSLTISVLFNTISEGALNGTAISQLNIYLPYHGAVVEEVKPKFQTFETSAFDNMTKLKTINFYVSQVKQYWSSEDVGYAEKFNANNFRKAGTDVEGAKSVHFYNAKPGEEGYDNLNYASFEAFQTKFQTDGKLIEYDWYHYESSRS